MSSFAGVKRKINLQHFIFLYNLLVLLKVLLHIAILYIESVFRIIIIRF